MDWNDLRVFLAVAEGGSLSAAAGTLGVSPSTVSRRIETLERDLNVKLFRPHRDGYDLTEDGRSLIPVAEQAAAQMRQVERHAAEARGHLAPVRIEAPELLAQYVLMPALRPLLQALPNLRVELRGSVRPARLITQEADIVLRLVRPERGNYRIRRLGRVKFGLYASRDHASAAGRPERPEDLHRHSVIGWTDDLDYLLMARWLASLVPTIEPALRVTTLSDQLAAVRMGIGWAVLPDFVAETEGLIPAMPDAPSLEPDLWLLTRDTGNTSEQVTLCRDAITAGLAERRLVSA